MGVLMVDLQGFIKEHDEKLMLLANDDNEIKVRFGFIKEQYDMVVGVFNEHGGFERVFMQEIGYYLPPQNIKVFVKSMKYIVEVAKNNGIKVNNVLGRKVMRQYNIWYPEQSHPHIKAMQYIRDTDKEGHELIRDLLQKKKNYQLYFQDFNELDYDDLSLLWTEKLISDGAIKELYSLKSASTVATRRKNLFINDKRTAALMLVQSY